MNKKVDVLFLGGGLSTCMAVRYLKLKHPEWEIAVVEKKTAAQWNPGESTVSIAGLYFARELGLSTYMYLNHLPKNGLRFFFKPESADQEISNYSEIGSNSLPYFPTFQMDRKRIVEDLWKMNQEIGISHQLGVEISELSLGQLDEDHRVLMSDGTEYRARWIVHGAGRESRYAPLFNELSPYQEDPEHQTAAGWGRWRGVEDLDSMGSDEWKSRAGHTGRYLSTNHFMGEGFWIWMIPIGDGIVSIGAVYDKKHRQDLNLQSFEQYQSFIKSHPVVSKMLSRAESLDFQSYGQLAFKRKYFCSENRWALIGDTFMFLDPFYSPGSDCISRESKHLAHLISADKSKLAKVVSVLNSYTEREYQLLKTIYCNQYPGFGSYEVYDIKSLWDFYSYTYRLLSSFVERHHENFDWLVQQNDPSQIPMELISNIQNGFVELFSHLKQEGRSQRLNSGKYSLKQNRFQIEEKILRRDFDGIEMLKHHVDLCRYVISRMLEVRFGLTSLLPLKSFQSSLTHEVMKSFKLSPEWLNFILAKTEKTLTHHGFEFSKGPLTLQTLADYDREFSALPAPQVQLWRGPVTNLVCANWPWEKY